MNFYTFNIKRDFDFYFDFPEFETFLSVYKRPHLDEFLAYLNENCEAILFSAGVESYVTKTMV